MKEIVFVGFCIILLIGLLRAVVVLFRDSDSKTEQRTIQEQQAIQAAQAQSQKRKMTDAELEQFMIACNASLAHEDEMRQYEEYFNANDVE